MVLKYDSLPMDFKTMEPAVEKVYSADTSIYHNSPLFFIVGSSSETAEEGERTLFPGDHNILEHCKRGREPIADTTRFFFGHAHQLVLFLFKINLTK